ncbi:MAG TPA: hypothetical protein VJS68_02565, partial [Thermoplasmata archaeon]|nr:hypothetical protein [Thermoplasmata archaeon]
MNETWARPSTPWPGVTTPVLQEAGVLSLVNNSFLAPSAPVYNARDPDVLAIGGNGTRLWVAGSDSAVAEFNLTSLAFVRWFPVGGLPTGLVSDPTDNTLVVPLNGSSSALFLNASTGALVRNVTLPAPAAGGCYVAAAGEVYLASPTTNTVFGLYASNETIRSVIPVGTAPV